MLNKKKTRSKYIRNANHKNKKLTKKLKYGGASSSTGDKEVDQLVSDITSVHSGSSLEEAMSFVILRDDLNDEQKHYLMDELIKFAFKLQNQKANEDTFNYYINQLAKSKFDYPSYLPLFSDSIKHSEESFNHHSLYNTAPNPLAAEQNLIGAAGDYSSPVSPGEFTDKLQHVYNSAPPVPTPPNREGEDFPPKNTIQYARLKHEALTKYTPMYIEDDPAMMRQELARKIDILKQDNIRLLQEKTPTTEDTISKNNHEIALLSIIADPNIDLTGDLEESEEENEDQSGGKKHKRGGAAPKRNQSQDYTRVGSLGPHSTDVQSYTENIPSVQDYQQGAADVEALTPSTYMQVPPTGRISPIQSLPNLQSPFSRYAGDIERHTQQYNRTSTAARVAQLQTQSDYVNAKRHLLHAQSVLSSPSDHGQKALFEQVLKNEEAILADLKNKILEMPNGSELLAHLDETAAQL